MQGDIPLSQVAAFISSISIYWGRTFIPWSFPKKNELFSYLSVTSDPINFLIVNIFEFMIRKVLSTFYNQNRKKVSRNCSFIAYQKALPSEPAKEMQFRFRLLHRSVNLNCISSKKIGLNF